MIALVRHHDTPQVVAEVRGQHEQLIGRVQEKYDIAREEAEKQVDQWAAEVKEKI